MTQQVSQLQTTEPNLFQDSYAQNHSDNSFQNYLDNEQQRLGLAMGAFGGFNLNTLFAYPELNFSQEISSYGNRLNSMLDQQATTNNHEESYAVNDNNSSPLPSKQIVSQFGDNLVNKPMQQILQELLQQSGFLTPNIEAQPLFSQAQLDGKLTSKLDMQFLIDEILTQIQLVKDKGNTKLMMGLKPDDLGEIILSLIAKSGMVSIQIEAEEKTKKLIEASLRELELALQRADVKINEIKIVATQEVGKHAV
ncbi:MAG: flagellar hook-length control protein FliK [bacterium]